MATRLHARSLRAFPQRGSADPDALTARSPELEKRTAIVTGASSGLGAEIAAALGELGWQVALGARREERLQRIASRVEVCGGSAFAHALDVSSTESIDRFFDAVEAHFGCADVVVNNAGISIPGRLHELAATDLAYELTVNLIGPAWIARRAIPPLLESGKTGDLVFISSDAARQPRPQQAAYSAAKAGLENFARALGMELEGTGLRCTIIRPGPAFSEYAASWGPEKIKELLGYWKHWGLQRHAGTMPSDAVARAVVVAVTSPRGVHFDTIEVQPEAPLTDAR